MRITVIAKPSSAQTFEVRELVKAARKLKVELDVMDIESVNPEALEAALEKTGEVVIWRSASVSREKEKMIFLSALEKRGKYFFNPGLLARPRLPFKRFQQECLRATSKLNTIATFAFQNKQELLAAIQAGKLKFPFVAKPDLGMRGQGVCLVQSRADLDDFNEGRYVDYIFQENIENSGDFRVLVVGGKAVTLMKRVKAGDSFVNNLSRGGSAQKVRDYQTREKLMRTAEFIAAEFGLSLAGVDLIFDDKRQQYYFLEVNTAPQWRGIQEITEFNIAEEIIRLARQLGERGKQNMRRSVRRFYDENALHLRAKQFHYWSRVYLWTKDSKALKELESLRENYIGLSAGQIKNKIEHLIRKPKDDNQMYVKEAARRKPYFDQYYPLRNYNLVLFRALFGEQIYGMDLRSQIKAQVPDKQLRDLFDCLIKDQEAMANLSAYAINYVYLLEYYLGEKLVKKEELWRMAQQAYSGKELNELMFKLYFLTHCIIGASLFYSRSVPAEDKELYLRMIKEIEQIIRTHYFEISLDNKFEFLVCAKLLDYKTGLKKIINGEAAHSWSKLGNFLVDSGAASKIDHAKKDLLGSEHRNVLFIMANTPWIGR